MAFSRLDRIKLNVVRNLGQLHMMQVVWATWKWYTHCNKYASSSPRAWARADYFHYYTSAAVKQFKPAGKW